VNISPKQRFLAEEKLAHQFLDQVDSEAFTRATELAMLALVAEVPPDGTMEFVRGADRFLEILRNLPEPAKPVPARRSFNLDHNLK
jgi:hypothetical protein